MFARSAASAGCPAKFPDRAGVGDRRVQQDLDLEPRTAYRAAHVTSGMQSDELYVLELVPARLDALGIAYMLSGSMAMSYCAQPRMTREIDLVVELELPQADGLVRLFATDCYCDADLIREAVRHQGMFNVIHDDTFVKVDFIVRKNTPYRRAEFARRRRVSVAGGPLRLASAEDLILSKLAWAKETHSPLHKGDVRNLIVAAEHLDRTYLGRWAENLSVTALLAEVRR